MIRALGSTIFDSFSRFGAFVVFTLLTVRGLFAGFRSWSRWSRLGTQLYQVGTRSTPVLALTGVFIGAILAVELYDQFNLLGQAHRIGGVVNISMLKQIGPVLAAVMLAGRVGCSLTAELGSMRVTDQIDAMRVMAADPIRVLVVPRVVACVVMIPVLTIVSNFCGVAGAWLLTVGLMGVNNDQYWEFSEFFIDWFDITNGLVKSLVFGMVIALIACYKGFTCRPGAQGVGRATTEAFVASFVSIVVLNLVLATFLNDLADIVRGRV